MEDFTNPWRDIEQIKKQLRTGIRTRANGRFVLFRDASLWVSTHPTSNIVAQMLEGSALLRAAMDSASTEDRLIIEEHEADPEREGGSHEEFVSLNVVVRVASHTGNDELREVLLDEIERRDRNDSRAASLTDDKAGQPHHPRAALEAISCSVANSVRHDTECPGPTIPRAAKNDPQHPASNASPALGRRTHKTRNRAVPLAAVFEKAKELATDRSDPYSVWAALVELAQSRNSPPELTDFREDRGIQATGARNGWLTKEAFIERWKRGTV